MSTAACRWPATSRSTGTRKPRVGCSPGASGDGYPESVATTWLIHLTDLATNQPAGLELLRLCAHLDPDDIDLTLLLSQPELFDAEPTVRLAAAAGAPGGAEDAIGALTRTSLLDRLDDHRIRIHRLVADITRRHLATDPAEASGTRTADAGWAAQVVGVLTGLFPAEPWEPATWPTCARLAAHARATADHAITADAVDGNTGTLLVRLGQYLDVRAEYAQARTTLATALAVVEAVYGPDHHQVATTLGNLGNVQQQLGELAAARASQERTLAIFEAVYGPDHPEVASTLGNLGIVQRQLGELAAARASQERALAIFEAVHRPDHPDVARALTNLGNVQQQLGELPAARASRERALAIFDAVYGPEHPHTVLAGRLLSELGDPPASEGA
jgi:Tfp pilus assembly protein PilF